VSIRDSWTVFTHELTNTLRDRRTWLTMVVIPLLMVPLLLIAAPTAIENQNQRIASSPPVIAVVGGEHAPGLETMIEQSGGLSVSTVDDPDRALAAGAIRAVIRVSPGMQGTSGDGLDVVIEYDASSPASEVARARLEAVVAAYAQRVVAERLLERGIDPSILTPLTATSRNVAPEERIGGYFLAMIMPMMLAVWVVLGGMYAAIDGVAGEKERGTLEPLLAAPPSRGSLVAGKYVAVLLTSVVAGGIALIGMYAAFLIKPEAVMGVGADAKFSINLGNAMLIVGISVLLAAFFSAIQLALSSVARSFREAQGYLSPLSIAVVIPGVMTQFVDPSEASAALFYVPVINAIFVFKEALLDSVDWNHVGVTAVSLLVWIVLALAVTSQLFKRESVLFRT